MHSYKRLLASYLLVCLIPLLMSLFTTVKLEQSVRDSIIEDRVNATRTLQKEMDSNLTDAANTVSILAQDTILDTLEAEADFSALDILSRQSIRDTLNLAVRQQSNIDSAFCYFYRSGHLITNERTFVPQVIDVYSQMNGFGFGSFIEAMQEANVVPTVQVLRSADGSVYLYLMQNRYDSRYKEKLSCVGVVIKVNGDLLRWYGESSEVFITDGGG